MPIFTRFHARPAAAAGNTTEASLDEFGRDTMLKRPGTPREVANCILFLASDESSFVTATCLLVDGDCYDFNQGTVRFHGEPRGSRRLEDKSELDLRAEWYMNVGDADGRFGIFLDIFNVTNQARFTLVQDRAGSTFEDGRSTNSPRTYRFGAKYSF